MLCRFTFKVHGKYVTMCVAGTVPEGDCALRQAALSEPRAVGDERRGNGENHESASAGNAARAAHQATTVRRVSGWLTSQDITS